MLLFFVQVRETDALPKQACRSCLQKLELCFHFRKTVLEAKKLLLASDGQAQIKREEMEENYRTSLLCSEPCPTMEHDDIEMALTTFSNKEINDNQSATTASEEQITDATVESNPVILASLKPCSVMLVPTKTHCRDTFNSDERSSSIVANRQKADLSPEILNSGRTSASHIDRQSLCESGVPGRTRSSSRAKTREALRTNCEEELKNVSIKINQQSYLQFTQIISNPSAFILCL